MNRSWTRAAGAAFAIAITIVLVRAETIVSPLREISAQRVAQQMPDRLVVTRAAGNSGRAQLPALSKTVTDGLLVAKLYGDILALPPFPPGPKNCLMQTNIRYPTGCAAVRLNDGTVESAGQCDFVADLAHSLGFASQQQLRGLR